jgi:hypothetical protein
MPLLLENPEQRSHRGGDRRIRKLIADLGGGRLTASIDNVHDLPLAAAEVSCLRDGTSHGTEAIGLRDKIFSH